jgi:6-phosphogluconate dehydrogenase (decarboxylating)
MKNKILIIFAIIGFGTIVTGFTNIVVNDSHQEIGRYQITATNTEGLKGTRVFRVDTKTEVIVEINERKLTKIMDPKKGD